MSYNPPYRNPPDGFSTNNDKYKDPQRVHPRESNAYMSRIRSTSSEQTSLSSSELSIFPPGKALSFLHSCGLDAEDLKTLAELPEHLITADALPDLLAEIKKKKMSSTSSSRSSALQASTSTRSWDDRSHTQSVEYPLDLPVRQTYSLNREQVPTWDDRWGNVQQTSSAARTYTSSEPNYVVEYNHLKDKKSYFDKASSYDTEPSRQKTSVVPQSYASYSQSSHLSSRDISQSSQRSGRDLGQSSHLSSRDLNSSSQRSSRDVSQSSHLSSRDVSLSSRNVGLPSLLSSRDVGAPSVLSSRGVGPHSLQSRRDLGPPSNLSSRDIGPPSFLSSRDVGLPSLLSIRDLAPPSRLSSRDASQPLRQRKREVIHIVPTRKEASDFHGKTPPVFPYACVLCEITVLSNKDWSVHVKGPQHANSQLSLVEKYPEWDQTIQSARRNESGSESSKSRTTQERGGTSSSRNGSSGSRVGASSSKSESSSSKNQNKTAATTKCKVVCVKFEVDEVDEAYLKKLLGQFGAIIKIIMFPKLAFVEMGTAGQAEDIVKYFLHNPLWIRGEMIQITLSAAFSFLQSSLVVSFSPLPSGDGISSELTAIAKRFGSVKHSLFLPSRGYVEMATVEEASKLVEHYSTNSLKLKGKTINVCFSAEYQTLGDVDKEKSPVPYSSRRRRSTSPKRRSRSSRRDSPSPKRRASEERSRSRRSHDSKKREESRSSREKTKESSRRDSSSKSHSKRSSPSKDQKQKTETEESVEEKVEEDNDQSEVMEDDSDLEGVAVIADDGEALNSEDEFTVDEDLDDEEYDITDVLTEEDIPEDVQTAEETNDQTKPSDMDTSNVQSETSECVPTATTSDSDCKDAQELQQGEQKELQQEELQKEEQKEPQQGKLQQGEQKELQKEEQKEPKQEELQQGEQKELQQGEQEELQQGEQKELQKGEQEELQKGEQEELQQGEQKDETVEMEEKATDFPENLENLSTSDEFKEEMLTEQGDEKEISALSTEEKYGRVVEVAGFPVAKKFSEKDLLRIGEKYGEVADCCLVRFNRKVEKALIEMVNAADAAKLEAESKRQRIRLGGKILRITVSNTYSQVNTGVDSDSERAEGQEHVEEKIKEPLCLLASSEESTVMMTETETSEEAAESQKETNTDVIMQTSSDEEEVYGRVLRIRNLPMPDEYSDADFLSIAEPYGKVKRHWMFRLHRTGLIEMENACDAEKVVSAANMNKITVAGKHPKVSVSTKHAHLNKRYFLYGPSDGSIQTSTELEKELWSDNPDVDSQGDEKQVSAIDDGNEMKAENSDSVSEAQTPMMDPVGTEFVRPVVGYFCSLCNSIYASEEEAKDEHCRTPLHHQKLKEHKERNSSS
ncbi:matrin 3-like 1.1 [Ctenopharyngodon idella]|uniref:matrin 3-like 1.1 n=1 Tax=Ctenopharyngodon idella TaxID=7959 RepID=UPI0022303AF6|nr:matrin 3-like 1.1 [Ctenopharyngodon idella]XP_051716043.1 matrin 3-like 1.1 [Ctenopharyngodon idella]